MTAKGKKTVRKVRKGRKGKKTGSWGGRQLGGIYRVVFIIHKFKVYRFFRHVPDYAIGRVSYLFTKLFFRKQLPKMAARIKVSLQGFTGKEYPAKFMKRIQNIVFMSMGNLLFDLMLKAPNYNRMALHDVMRFENLDILDEALKKGRGVLMPSIHIGQFFHCLGGLLLHESGYKVAGVGNMTNRLLFDHIVSYPQYRNLVVVGKDKFHSLKENLVKNLKENHIIFLMHDIARGNNLRTRFIDGRSNFLVPTPQGIVALHRETGAPIIPMVSIPDGRFTRSILRILDPSEIERVSRASRNASPEEFHGRLSTAINKVLFPYAISYLPYWEEVMTVGSRIFNVSIRFKRGATLLDIMQHSMNELVGVIKGSFEPGRKDGELISWLTGLFNESNFDAGKLGKYTIQHKSFVTIGGLTTPRQIKKMLSILARLSKKAGDGQYSSFLLDKRNEVHQFFNTES
ncbi:MAG: LpxL/LpxP family acyltransferase [Promethearchaeota archaeon]